MGPSKEGLADWIGRLIELALCDTAGACPRLDERNWERVLEELDAHRLTPWIAWAFHRSGADAEVPETVRVRLRESYRRTRLVTEVHVRATREILGALRERGVDPIVFKGAILAAGYYPDPGCRTMVDIDLLVDPRNLRRAVRVLREKGFTRIPMRNMFHHPVGLILDLHWEFRLFPDRTSLTRHVDVPALGEAAVRTWEPNALVTHLVHHLYGHRRSEGLRLMWVVDFAFVLQRHGDELDAARLRELALSPSYVELLGQVLGLLQGLGVSIPSGLGGLIRPAPAFGVLLRECRVRPWGLPGPLGWLRVLRGRMTGSRRLRYPVAGDLAGAVVDRLTGRW